MGAFVFGFLRPIYPTLLVSEMAPLNAEWVRLMSDPEHIDSLLRRGAERAQSVSEGVLKQVYDTVGFASLTGQKYLKTAERLFLGAQLFCPLYHNVSGVLGFCSG